MFQSAVTPFPRLLPGMNILVGSTTWADRLVGHATYPIFHRGVRYTHALKVTDPETAVEAQFDKNVVAETSLRWRFQRWEEEGVPVLVRDLFSVSDSRREMMAFWARQLLGRRYDYVQAGLFAVTGRFWWDGDLRLVCSRVCTAVDAAVGYRDEYLTAAQLATHRRYADHWSQPWRVRA